MKLHHVIAFLAIGVFCLAAPETWLRRRYSGDDLARRMRTLRNAGYVSVGLSLAAAAVLSLTNVQ